MANKKNYSKYIYSEIKLSNIKWLKRWADVRIILQNEDEGYKMMCNR